MALREKEASIVDFILNSFYRRLKTPITLLGVSPISIHIVKGALLSAMKHNAPIMFIASLNQVDVDGGYTGWTPYKFVRLVKELVSEMNFENPVIIASDHCGPWLKDKHLVEGLSLEEAMEDVKASIEAAIKAGYDILHIDTTVDINDPKLDVEIVAERTLELIDYAENLRREEGLPKISYEVGSDRWGIKDPSKVRELLVLLKRGLRDKGLDDIWPSFIVGDLGTALLPRNQMNLSRGIELVKIASEFNSYVKGHSTDYVKNPEDYPKIGIGGANVGPEFADVEYRALRRLSKLEEEYSKKYGFRSSNLINALTRYIERDGRWRKYAKSATNLNEIPEERREWVIGISSRYVYAEREVIQAMEKLCENLREMGINGKEYVVREVAKAVERYILAFNLSDSALKLKKLLEGTSCT